MGGWTIPGTCEPQVYLFDRLSGLDFRKNEKNFPEIARGYSYRVALTRIPSKAAKSPKPAKTPAKGPFPPKTPVSALPRLPNRKTAEIRSHPAPGADSPIWRLCHLNRRLSTRRK